MEELNYQYVNELKEEIAEEQEVHYVDWNEEEGRPNMSTRMGKLSVSNDSENSDNYDFNNFNENNNDYNNNNNNNNSSSRERHEYLNMANFEPGIEKPKDMPQTFLSKEKEKELEDKKMLKLKEELKQIPTGNTPPQNLKNPNARLSKVNKQLFSTAHLNSNKDVRFTKQSYANQFEKDIYNILQATNIDDKSLMGLLKKKRKIFHFYLQKTRWQCLQ